MKRSSCVLFTFLVLLLMKPYGLIAKTAPDKSAAILLKQLKAEEARAKKLKQERQQLQEWIQQGKSRMKRFDSILQTYNYNLTQAQKVIDAAESEIGQIHKRNNERELLFYHCVNTFDQMIDLRSSDRADDQMLFNMYAQAVSETASKIFSDMLAEQPRLHELEQVITDRRAYQDRIMKKYMPADTEKKERHERLLNKREEEAKAIQDLSKQNAQRVTELKNQLAAAQKRIEEIRLQRLKEQREREEKERQELAKRQQTAAANSKTTSPPQPLPSGTPFANRKGALPWPARGTIVRPFGEFTHPEFKVKIDNPGIDVRIKPGAPILAVAPGRVLYTGDIPGIGPAVILDHGGDYCTVYGNVISSVSENNNVESQSVIGNAATKNTDGTSAYHFQILQGKRSLNPLSWLVK